MIVAVCSAKGSPGVTTVATVLTLGWAGERILLEADPSGGDLSLRMHAPGTQYLAREPTILTLAMAVRSGARGDGLPGYAQATSLGIAVIPGPPVMEAWTPMLPLWEQVAGRIREWPGTVIADMGRLQPGHPGWALVEAADVVLLVTTTSVEALFHAREHARELERVLGSRTRRDRVAVVVRRGIKDKGALGEVSQVLQQMVPVVGGIADDPRGVALLGGGDSAHLRRSVLMRSGVNLIGRIQRSWPEPPTPAPMPPVRLLREAP